MESVSARTGRHRQRYEDNRRLVSGCIPYRLVREEGKDIKSSRVKEMLQVLMITTPNRTDLVFPKGGWENDETVEDAACREALEEAGVKGVLNKTQLGVWEFTSKSRQELGIQRGGCRGHMFALRVTQELDTWPEQENHDRRWLSVEEALEMCRYEWMRDALAKFSDEMVKKENRMNVNRQVIEVATTAGRVYIDDDSSCARVLWEAFISLRKFVQHRHCSVVVV